MGWNAQDAMMREADPMSYDRLVVKVASPSSVLHTHTHTQENSQFSFCRAPIYPLLPSHTFSCVCVFTRDRARRVLLLNSCYTRQLAG